MAATMQVACKAFIIPPTPRHAPRKNATRKFPRRPKAAHHAVLHWSARNEAAVIGGNPPLPLLLGGRGRKNSKQILSAVAPGRRGIPRRHPPRRPDLADLAAGGAGALGRS